MVRRGRWWMPRKVWSKKKKRYRRIMEDGACLAAFMCGLWVDGVAELWLWNGSWQSHFSRGDLPRLFPEVGGRDWTTLSTCHEYLFGESVHRLLHRMTNRSLQSNYLYSVLFIPQLVPPVTVSRLIRSYFLLSCLCLEHLDNTHS